jgi:hypothetical protein
MQNPGSDAGVFVWADGADGRYCAVTADARATPRRKIRNVTLKKHVTPARISLLCTWLGKYTMVCVDN